MRTRFVRFEIDGTTATGATNLMNFDRERGNFIGLQTAYEIFLTQKLREGNQPAVSVRAAGLDKAPSLGDIAGTFQQ
jgi:hypothetical protein